MARLEASLDFPDEGYHFIDADERRASALDRRAAATRRRCSRTPRAAAWFAKARVVDAGRRAERRQVEPVQRAAQHQPRDCHAGAGTTRDLLTERVDIAGLSLALVDTAGLRDTETMSSRKACGAREGSLAASPIWCWSVLDRSRPSTDDDRACSTSSGGPAAADRREQDRFAGGMDRGARRRVADVVPISVRTGDGLAASDRSNRRETLSQAPAWRDVPLVTNVRHVAAARASARVTRARPRWRSPSRGACPKSSCWPTCRKRRSAFRRSPAGAPPTICSGTSSSASASASKSAPRATSSSRRCHGVPQVIWRRSSVSACDVRGPCGSVRAGRIISFWNH